MTKHSLSHVQDRHLVCSCGQKFGPGPYKMKALNAHIKHEREEA